ncbi:hypothetical protein AB4562_06840 [Vibrio sp. 10N.222.54.A1]
MTLVVNEDKFDRNDLKKAQVIVIQNHKGGVDDRNFSYEFGRLSKEIQK